MYPWREVCCTSTSLPSCSPSHCGFDLHFPKRLMTLNIFKCFVAIYISSFEEMCMQIFGQILIGLFKSSSCILDAEPLSEILFANIYTMLQMNFNFFDIVL